MKDSLFNWIKESGKVWVRKTLSYLGEKWGNVIKLFFDPMVIILFALIIWLYLSNSSQKNTTILFIITIALSVFTGLLGGILTKRWDDFTEKKAIEIRGDSAIRNLHLLLSRSTGLEKRVIEYYSRYLKDDKGVSISTEVLKTYFEEIIYECADIDETIINSIEDWNDLRTGEDLLQSIAFIKVAKENLLRYQSEFKDIQSELNSNRGNKDEELGLRTRMDQIIQNMNDEYRNITIRSSASGLNNYSGSVGAGGTIAQNINFDNQYFPYRPGNIPLSTLLNLNLPSDGRSTGLGKESKPETKTIKPKNPKK